MLRDGDIGITGNYQFFAVKEHINDTRYECYWAVFTDDSIIDFEQRKYYVNRKADNQELRVLKSFLIKKGYFLKDNKIIKCNEF